MLQITLAEASENLAYFVDAALNGEEVILLKEDQPVAKLTSLELTPKHRPAKAGSAKGLVWISDDFDEPLEEFKKYME